MGVRVSTSRVWLLSPCKETLLALQPDSVWRPLDPRSRYEMKVEAALAWLRGRDSKTRTPLALALLTVLVSVWTWGGWMGLALTGDICLWASLDSLPQREAQVVFITVGDEDLARFPARDPEYLDRKIYAQVVDRLVEFNARSIVFDVLFDRKTPEADDTDKVFGEAVARANRVIMARCFIKDPETEKIGILEPIDELKSGTRGLGLVNVRADDDGVIRRVKLMMEFDGRPYHHIALESVIQAKGLADPLESDDGLSLPGGDLGSTLFIPTTRDGRSIANYAAVPRIERVSISELLAEDTPPAVLKALVGGKIALIGSSSPLLKDRHPYSRNWLTGDKSLQDGAWFIAAFIENTLSGSFLVPMGADSKSLPFLAFVFLALTFSSVTVTTGIGIALAFFVGTWGLSFHYFGKGQLLDATVPSMAIAATYLSQVLSRVMSERRRYARKNQELSIEIAQVRDELEKLSQAGHVLEGDGSVANFLDKGFMARFLPDHYEDLEFLGQGGMGVVYKARDTRRNEILALKILSPLVQDNPTAVERFLKEAQVMKKLAHPGLVSVRDIGKDVLSFFTMELVEGVELDEFLKDKEEIKPRLAVTIIKKTAEVLGYIHGKGIIHRDIKPSNVMLLKDNSIKLLDFGLARDEDMTSVTRTGDVLGTLKYMAPEQFAGRHAVPATDVYSLGVLFCQMLAGEAPERQGNTHVSPRVLLDGKKIPGTLVDLLERMMHEIHEMRPENGAAVARELAVIEADLASEGKFSFF